MRRKTVLALCCLLKDWLQLRGVLFMEIRQHTRKTV